MYTACTLDCRPKTFSCQGPRNWNHRENDSPFLQGITRRFLNMPLYNMRAIIHVYKYINEEKKKNLLSHQYINLNVLLSWQPKHCEQDDVKVLKSRFCSCVCFWSSLADYTFKLFLNCINIRIKHLTFRDVFRRVTVAHSKGISWALHLPVLHQTVWISSSCKEQVQQLFHCRRKNNKNSSLISSTRDYQSLRVMTHLWG